MAEEDKVTASDFFLRYLRRYAKRGSLQGIKGTTLHDIEEKIGFISESRRKNIKIGKYTLEDLLKEIDRELKVRGIRDKSHKEALKVAPEIQIREYEKQIEEKFNRESLISEKSDKILGSIVGDSTIKKTNKLIGQAAKTITSAIIRPDRAAKRLLLNIDSIITSRNTNVQRAYKTWINKKENIEYFAKNDPNAKKAGSVLNPYFPLYLYNSKLLRTKFANETGLSL